MGLQFGLKNIPPFSSLLYNLIYLNAIAIAFNSKNKYYEKKCDVYQFISLEFHFFFCGTQLSLFISLIALLKTIMYQLIINRLHIK